MKKIEVALIDQKGNTLICKLSETENLLSENCFTLALKLIQNFTIIMV